MVNKGGILNAAFHVFQQDLKTETHQRVADLLVKLSSFGKFYK